MKRSLANRIGGALALLVIASSPPASAQDHWPQFRGADSLGVSANKNLPEKWSTTENVEWKQDLPGVGGRVPSCG